GRVGNDDAAFGCSGKVDAVVADTEIGNDLEFRQGRDQGAADRRVAAAGDAADLTGDFRGDRLVAVTGVVALEQRVERLAGLGRKLIEAEDFDFGQANLLRDLQT